MDIRNIFEQTFLWSAYFLMACVWKKLLLAGSVNRKHYLCKKRTEPQRLCSKSCRRPESNRYGYHYPRDFKSRASASSATTAYFFHTYLSLKSECIRAGTITLSRYVNGRRWIRTTEGSASRFTVCPLWPLGNSPMAFTSSNDNTIRKGKNQ